MKKIYYLKGLPGSGKSTFAKELVEKSNGAVIRTNKDSLREMLHNSQHSKGRESFVLMVRNFIIKEALLNGKNVIVDDTNFEDRHLDMIREIAKEVGDAEIEIKFFDVPLEECIKRDAKRANGVGEKAIRTMYRKYLEQKAESPTIMVQNESLERVFIYDIDGTIALLNGRDPYDASTCENDLPNTPVIETLKSHLSCGKYSIILMSGREDKYREQTERWLQKHSVHYRDLYMRKAGDFRKDSIIKRELFDNHIRDKYYVMGVYDDRSQVVDMWRHELGLMCCQVADGDF